MRKLIAFAAFAAGLSPRGRFPRDVKCDSRRAPTATLQRASLRGPDVGPDARHAIQLAAVVTR
jgi:hypothetical protein